jgi:hypothetical protein
MSLLAGLQIACIPSQIAWTDNSRTTELRRGEVQLTGPIPEERAQSTRICVWISDIKMCVSKADDLWVDTLRVNTLDLKEPPSP